jgi:AraC-like DNA-binding protein
LSKPSGECMRKYLPFQPPVLQHELLDADYRYREFWPSKCLEALVACYWTVDFKASAPHKLHRIIPDGCVDIIFDLKSSSLSKGAFVVGLMTQFETINLFHNQSLFGVRLFSNSVHHVIRYPISELKGNRVLLEDVWGNEALFLTEEVISGIQISEIIGKVENKLLELLLLNKSRPDYLLQASIKYIYAHQGMLSIRSLAEKLNYCEKNIRRIFRKELGVSPKELSDIIRFQSLLKELNSDSKTGFADVALKFGYYDQPHLNHIFKRYYGLSPGQVFPK